MKFGIATLVTDEGIGPAELAGAAQDRGFDSVFIAEHTHVPAERRTPFPGGGDMPREYYRTLDPFVALSAMASATRTILLGTAVALITQRDPIVTAKAVATLDHLSHGRVAFGVGVGWSREEMRSHGIDPATRGRRADEYLEAMIRLWTREQAEFHGEFVDFAPAYVWPKPVQQPHPPIYVGGGRGAFPRIARFGDAWLVNSRPVAELGSQIEEMRSAAGRSVPVTVSSTPLDPDLIESYGDLDVERILIYIPTCPSDASLRLLDDAVHVIEKFR